MTSNPMRRKPVKKASFSANAIDGRHSVQVVFNGLWQILYRHGSVQDGNGHTETAFKIKASRWAAVRVGRMLIINSCLSIRDGQKADRTLEREKVYLFQIPLFFFFFPFLGAMYYIRIVFYSYVLNGCLLF